MRTEFLPGNRFLVEIEGDESEAIQLIKAKGLEAELLNKQTSEDNRLALTVRVEGTGELGPQLIRALQASSECKLHSVAPQIPNLEEIFLAATKRSWEETIDVTKKKPTPAPQN